MKARLLSQKGFSLTELAIAIGFVGGIGLVGMKVIENSSRAVKKNSGSSDLRSIRAEILSTLQNPEHFEKTVNHFNNRTTFACLKAETEGCKDAAGEFRIYRRTIRDTILENNYVSLSSTTAGFDQNGVRCNSFDPDPGEGSDSCPYKYVASWTAICPEVARIQGKDSVETRCRNPLFKVSVKLMFNPRDPKKFPLASAKQDINLVIAQAGSDQNMLCNMTGNGYFDSSTNTCVHLRTGDASCAITCPEGSNSFVKGFYEDGSLNCECGPVPALMCPNNQVVLGVNDDGSLSCGNALIAGLEYSGAINNTPETYVAYLRQKLMEATTAKNAAEALQAQAQAAQNAAQAAYDAAEAKAKDAQIKLDQAKAAAASTPTGDLQKALDDAIAAYNLAQRDLQIARAELQQAQEEVLKTQAAETAAQLKLDEFLASLQ